MERLLKLVWSEAPLPDPGPSFTFSVPTRSVQSGVARRPHGAIFLVTGGDVQTTCSGGRCPQPISLDREAELQGLCYFHSKVKNGLIQDYYEGPTYDDEGHKTVEGELVTVTLP